ncbi:hypothetical protein ACIGXM_23565 [Kitasatospora sp. NPDC052896]|uniref:hypothetical protein n=1 Tax=Kitasatospora sp. NPDC052896 TaxID=3364061 RepID=UPI0037C5B150
MNEELAELATSAATALVSAMGTDLWQEAKRLMSGILVHGGRRRRRELTAALDRLSTAGPAHLTGCGRDAAGLVRFWSDALAQLLEQHPDFAEHARALASLPIQEQPGKQIQLNSATNSGEVYAVQNGTQHIVAAAKLRRDPAERPR